MKQDAKQESRQNKVDCKAADQKNNAECRQDKRDTKQSGRESHVTSEREKRQRTNFPKCAFHLPSGNDVRFVERQAWAACGGGFNRSTRQLDEIAQLEFRIAASSLVVR